MYILMRDIMNTYTLNVRHEWRLRLTFFVLLTTRAWEKGTQLTQRIKVARPHAGQELLADSTFGDRLQSPPALPLSNVDNIS